MSKGNVLIFGDSLSLPRRIHNKEGVLCDLLKYEDTYISKLTNSFLKLNFVSLVRGGETTEILGVTNFIDINNRRRLYLDVGEYNPSLVLVFLGIVDCAPRLFTRNESAIISRLYKFMIILIIKIVKKIRIRSVKRAYTQIDRFIANFDGFFNYCSDNNVNVIVVGIPYVDKRAILKNKFFNIAIKSYNEALYDLIKTKYQKVHYVDLFNCKDDEKSDSFLEDGYHLSKIGHLKVFDTLKPIIEQLIL